MSYGASPSGSSPFGSGLVVGGPVSLISYGLSGSSGTAQMYLKISLTSLGTSVSSGQASLLEYIISECFAGNIVALQHLGNLYIPVGLGATGVLEIIEPDGDMIELVDEIAKGTITYDAPSGTFVSFRKCGK